MRLSEQLSPLIGWRHWNTRSGELRSLHDGVPWSPGLESVARCKETWSHDSPVPDCTCGLYATKPEARIYPLSRTISGPVALWGRVVEHEFGYRAARGYPQALTLLEDFHCGVPVDADPAALAVLRSYGVPIRIVGLAEIEETLVRDARLARPYGGRAEMDRTIQSARALSDAGKDKDAMLTVLERAWKQDLRRIERLELTKETCFLHYAPKSITGGTVTGPKRAQTVTIRGRKSRQFFYTNSSIRYSTQDVTFNSATGNISELFTGCDLFGSDPSHATVCPGPDLVRTIRPGPALAIECWIQLLDWTAGRAA